MGRTDEEDVARIIKGTYNILKHLGIIPGRPERVAEPVWIREYTIVRSEHDGLFYPLVRRGQHVQKGEQVGYMTDFFGNIIQKVRAPHTGIVLYVIATPPMSRGEPLISIGKF